MYNTAIAYLLWFLSGFGALGFHRFYLNKIGSGLIWLLTGGLLMVGSIYDFFTIPAQVREANLRLRYREAIAFKQQRGIGEEPRRRRINNESVEQIILKTAKKNKGVVSPSEIALEAEIPLEKAKKNLENLAENGYADLRVTKSGVIVFVFPDFMRDQPSQDFEPY